MHLCPDLGITGHPFIFVSYRNQTGLLIKIPLLLIRCVHDRIIVVGYHVLGFLVYITDDIYVLCA